MGSIQEPEKDNGLVVVTPNIDTKFKLTLEPTMMFLLLGVNISSKCYNYFVGSMLICMSSICNYIFTIILIFNYILRF